MGSGHRDPPRPQQPRLRYLAVGDYWFDEETADGRDGTNSRLHA
ncbi:hypothetical protein ACFXPI_00365 [Streptomyces sp. NPDC059104]